MQDASRTITAVLDVSACRGRAQCMCSLPMEGLPRKFAPSEFCSGGPHRSTSC